MLGHAKVGLQRTYNKHDYADEKRQALEAYAKHVMGVVGELDQYQDGEDRSGRRSAA